MKRLFKKGDIVGVGSIACRYIVLTGQDTKDQEYVFINKLSSGNDGYQSIVNVADLILLKEAEPQPDHVVEDKEPVVDNVNHPAHYNQGGIECIDAIKAALTEEEFRGFCKGSALSYIWREKHKGGMEDILKAEWYLDRLKQ